jgi:sugar lactone lactonase YvrE
MVRAMKPTTMLFVTFAALTACKKDNKDQPAPDPGPGTAAAGTGAGTAGSADPGSAAAPTGATTVKDVGLATPESVLYDAGSGGYLVSNINGEAAGADDNGFITKLAPDGKVTELKWIDGASADVKLDAPKGMAISGGTLWVTDITVVRKFDAKTGEPAGEVAIEGAAFLNDVVADGADGVYVTDTGMNAKFEPNGADGVYRIAKDGKVTPVAKDKTLYGPNGVWAEGDAVWVASFRSNEVYRLSADGKKADVAKLPKGQLDGLVGIGGGELLVSSWEASAVYRGKPGGEWKEVATGVKAPADIGWDPERKAILIPQFQDSAVVIQPLP